jgi:ribosomal protein S18 acetylase RimI-like enzyme
VEKNFKIRPYKEEDRVHVKILWEKCNLLFPGNDPDTDIDLKMSFQPNLFFIGEISSKIIASMMVGYDGHRGWINYLGVHPSFQKSGYGTAMVRKAIEILRELNCPKINIQVRKTNLGVINFYKNLGFKEHEVISMQLKL